MKHPMDPKDYEFQYGERVVYTGKPYNGLNRGMQGVIVDADAYEAIWADVGVDVINSPNPPTRPPWQPLQIQWDEKPAGWQTDTGFASSNEVRSAESVGGSGT